MYKDFSGVNEQNKLLSQGSEKSDVMQKFLNAISNRNQSCRDVASEWARAYAGVQTVEYDSDGHVQDVTSENAISTVDSVLYRALADFKANDNQAKDLNDLFRLVAGRSSSVILESSKQLLDMLGYINLDNFYNHDNQQLFHIGVQGGTGAAKLFYMKVNTSSLVPLLPDMMYPVPFSASFNEYRSGYTPDLGNVVLDDPTLFTLDSEGVATPHSLNCLAHGLNISNDASSATVAAIIPVYYTRNDGHIIVTNVQALLTVEHGWTKGSANVYFIRCQTIGGNGSYVVEPSTDFTDITTPVVNVTCGSVGIKLKDVTSGLYPRDANNLPSDIEVQTLNDLFTLLSIPTGSGMEDALSQLLD